MNQQSVPKFDKFLRREQIFKNEKKLNQLQAYYYQGIQLNKKELHEEAIRMLDFRVQHPEDLEIYVSSTSVTDKPNVFKHPEWMCDK